MHSEEKLPSPGRPLGRVCWVYCLALLLLVGCTAVLLAVVRYFAPVFGAANTSTLLLQTVVMFAVVLPVVRHLLPERSVTMPPSRRKLPAPLTVRLFFVGLAMMLTVSLATMALLSWFAPELTDPLQLVVEPSNLPVLVLVGVILGPLGEELLFRGLLLRSLRDYGDGICCLTSGLFFGLFHINLYQMFYAAVLGAFFAWLVRRTGRLRIAVAFHVLYNALGLLVLPWATGSESITVKTAASVVIIAVIVFGFIQFAFRVAYLEPDPGPLPLSFRRKVLLLFTRPGIWVYIALCVALTAVVVLGMQML